MSDSKNMYWPNATDFKEVEGMGGGEGKGFFFLQDLSASTKNERKFLRAKALGVDKKTRIQLNTRRPGKRSTRVPTMQVKRQSTPEGKPSSSSLVGVGRGGKRRQPRTGEQKKK